MKDKIIFDEISVSSKNFYNSTIVYALDTENTNNNDIESITYCTSLIEVGNKKDKSEFNKNKVDIVNIFTHPFKFWEYILNDGYETSELYVFNADYDVENLLPYLIIMFPQMKPKQYNYTLTESGYYEKDKKNNVTPYTFDFIKTNNSIIQLNLTINCLKETKSKKVFKQIKIYDLAKRLGVGSLASNVSGYLGYEMSKEGLDYNKFRDFGHMDYSENELKYIWEDTYYLKELVYEIVYVQKLSKLTAGSNSINNYKETNFIDFLENYNNKKHPIYKLFKGYFKHNENYIKKLQNKTFLNANETRVMNSYKSYIENNGDKSHNDFIINHLCKKQSLFDYIFPTLEYDEFKYCFKAYKGGITRYNKPLEVGKWINEEGYSFDINSSYPNSMRYKELPYGYGKYKKGRAIKKKNKVFIQRLKVSGIKIIDGYEPIIALSKGKYGTEETWVKNYNEEVEITITSVEMEYMFKAYNFLSVEFIDYIEFNAQVGLFNTFIDKNYHIKQTSKGSPKNVAKLFLNSLYGKMGQSATTDLRGYIYDEEYNRVNEYIEKDENDMNKEVKMNQIYLPVAVFTTAYSRLKLVNILNNCNKQKGVKWVYCDTDSVYMLGNKENCIKAMGNEFDIDNTGELGLWKLEKNFIGINVIGIKKYICKIKEDNSIKYKVTLSGINKRYFDIIEQDLSKNENIINIISHNDLNIINSGNYYTKQDNVSQLDPYIYYDKECTKRIIGAYKSIRKMPVKNGVVLSYSVYCIKGGK